MAKNKVNQDLNSRYVTLRLTIKEIEVLNTALCAAYVDYSVGGKWVENFLPCDEQKKRAVLARNAMRKIDSKMAALMRLEPERAEMILQFCSQMEDEILA